MLKPVDQKTLQAAIEALKIDVPIYSAIRMKDGSIQIATRNGIQTWKPPAPPAKAQAGRKRKTQTPRKAKGKAHLSASAQADT